MIMKNVNINNIDNFFSYDIIIDVLKFQAFLVKFLIITPPFLFLILDCGYVVIIIIVANILQSRGRSMSFWGIMGCASCIKVVYVI